MDIAVIIEAFRLDLDVLAQQVQAQLLHAQDIPLILLCFRRQIDSVTEISLIQDAMEENGLSVQADLRDAVMLLHGNGPEAEIGGYFVLSQSYRHFV